MKKKKIVVACILLYVFAIFTGCGTKKIDVMESLTLNYSGVNGYGIAEIEDIYAWESSALEAVGIQDIDSFSDLEDAFIIESAVSYDISPKENLSNGDEVIVTAQIDNEAVEKYKIKFEAKEKKFVVEGLPEVQTIDLFENIDVTFQGIAPNATATVIDASTDYYTLTRYVINKDSNLDIGDVITVTAEYDKDQLLKAGYVAESDTKEFVVTNVSRYISELADIPEETVESLKKQTEDIINSNVARINGYTLKNLNFIGNYFMKLKSDYTNYGNKNITYYVYQVDITGKEDITYYYYVGYNDILLTEDDICVYDFNNVTSTWKTFYKGWTGIDGYINLDELFNECVTKHLDKYEYESTVTETEE